MARNSRRRELDRLKSPSTERVHGVVPFTLDEIVDGAAIVHFSQLPPVEANAAAIRLDRSLAEQPMPGVLDSIPGAETLLILFNPRAITPAKMEARLGEVNHGGLARSSREIIVPVTYGGSAGPDLRDLASARRTSADELIRIHGSASYCVDFVGFAPGFPYLSGLPEVIQFPRLSSPRPRVPRGSVAIADRYSGIYPTESPGGWRLIGRTPLRLFDGSKSPPALMSPGDRVRFEAISDQNFAELEGRADLPNKPAPVGTPVLRVLKAGPSTRIEGAPRFGYGRWGVPSGGAMDAVSLAEANLKLGNNVGACGLEITLGNAAFEILSPRRFCIGGAVAEIQLDGHGVQLGEPFVPKIGERIGFGPLRAGVRTYLAVDEGLVNPVPLGGIEQAVRGGDIIRAMALADSSSFFIPVNGPRSVLRVVFGPQNSHFSAAARETLAGSEYTVSTFSDRRGIRLEGPILELIKPADIPPEGTAPGSIQVPGNGLPIILGPDRPVTGGYAKIATVIGADLSILGQLRPGEKVRFEAVDLAQAKRAIGLAE